MSEDIKPDVIKKTQDTLGKYVKKPPLTEKLLKKPPFRFLHDIILAINKDYIMFDGIFTETELKSENIKEKDDKIKFLYKLINTMKLLTNTDIAARPSKIVAGHEPTKTNELLQIIGKAIQKNLTAESILEQIKEENLDLTKDIKFKQKKEPVESISHRKSKGTTVLKKSSNEKLKKVDKKNTEILLTSREKIRKQKHDTNKFEKVKSEKLLHIESSNSDVLLNSSQPEINLISTDDPKKEELIVEIPSMINAKTESSNDKENQEKIEYQNMTNNSNIIELDEAGIPEPNSEIFKDNQTNLENASNEPILLESSNLPSKKIDKLNKKLSESDLKINIPRQPSARPRTSLRPPSARPPSARPAAPRIRDRNDVILPPEKVVPLGKVNVIVENFDKNSKDDNENLVVVESTSNITEIALPFKTPTVEDQQQQGHLVAQILETQKELMEDTPKVPIQIEWEKDSQRNRETKKRYIENMRMKIQTITRAALPLGQIINFLQEDYDNIIRELQMWRHKNEKLNEDIAHQKLVADRNLEPFRKQYTEMVEEIEKQKERNNILKSEIYRNQQRIDKLLTTLI